MTETQIYENIKQAISSAPRNSQTMEMHLQMIKYADHLKKVTAKEFCEGVGLKASFGLMNPLMILVKIIKLRWIHILSYDQMVSRKINNQTTRCANSIFYTTLFTNSAPNYT